MEKTSFWQDVREFNRTQSSRATPDLRPARINVWLHVLFFVFSLGGLALSIFLGTVVNPWFFALIPVIALVDVYLVRFIIWYARRHHVANAFAY